jgi:hypothetical protein
VLYLVFWQASSMIVSGSGQCWSRKGVWKYFVSNAFISQVNTQTTHFNQSNPGLLFLRRMRCPLRHAASDHIKFFCSAIQSNLLLNGIAGSFFNSRRWIWHGRKGIGRPHSLSRLPGLPGGILANLKFQFGYFWRVCKWNMLLYLTAIRYVLHTYIHTYSQLLHIFYGLLV